jgi:hypothetical protein
MKSTKYQIVREIIDLLGADCSKSLMAQRLNELKDQLDKIKLNNPTIKLVEGYKGKHKVTFCHWADSVRRSYKTDIYQIEVVKKDKLFERIEYHKGNFTINTILFWYEKDSYFNGFQGLHIFKHLPKSEVGAQFCGSSHKVFKTSRL